MKRRQLLGTTVTVSAALLGGCSHPRNSLANVTQPDPKPLPIPKVMLVDENSPGGLTAIQATHSFSPEHQSPSLGFDQSYLGPVIRVNRKQTARINVTNRTNSPITTHWHGLHIDGQFDGGPHSPVMPGKTWPAVLRIDQPVATLWYHSHIHGKTAEQVYTGLAGMMIIDDPDAPPTGLPETYGIDDLPLIIQDRAFAGDGTLYYSKRGPNLMHGFRGDQIVVNGAIRPIAKVPGGLVRLRLLNASNARIYTFSFGDERSFHQVASDAGLLTKPIQMQTIQLAPAERAEIIVDFSDGGAVRLLSTGDANSPMRGMMQGRMMGRDTRETGGTRFEVMSFTVERNRTAAITELPKQIDGAPALPDWGTPTRRREFALNMGMMGGRMGRGRGGMTGMGVMSINGESMAMDRINFQTRLGETELWRITSDQMAHPFHVHGTSFQIISINGKPQKFSQTGLKDVVLVDAEAEILVRFTRKASKAFPYMYHCHILEHEDAGMMGQFTVI